MKTATLMTPDTNSATMIAMSIICKAMMINNAFFLFIFFSFLSAFLGQTFGFSQSLSDNPLELAIGAAELVRSPGLYRVHRFSVNAQNEILCFFLRHELMVKSSR